MYKLMIATILVVLNVPLVAQAGNCDRATDRASDGSICGDRAAERRPGGR